MRLYRDCYYPEDVKRIVEAARDAGAFITAGQAETMWNLHSAERYAGWVALPDDDQEIIDALFGEDDN